MAATITIFANFTPNTDGGEYYFPKTTTNGLTFNQTLLEYFKTLTTEHEELTGYTYKIYENYIDIGQPIMGSAAFGNITYVAVSYDNRILFYYVDSIQLINTGSRLYIRLDTWATYIGQARINHLKFRRSNVKLDFEDEPVDRPLYYTEKSNIDMGKRAFLGAFTGQARGRLIARNNLRVYATIKHRTISDFATTIEEINTYQFNPSDIATTPTVTENDIYKFINLVASIFGVNEQLGTFSAEVLHIYLLEKDVIPRSTSNLRFKGSLDGAETEIVGNEVRPGINNQDIKLYNTREGGNVTAPTGTIKISQLGKDIYFGTKYNGLKLPYFVGEFTIRFTVFANNDNLTFLVQAGEEIKDITTSFEITAIANTGSLVGIQAAAKWLGIIANTAGGAFQIAAGGAGVVSGTAQIANAILGIPNNNNGTYIGAGDGITTFSDIISSGFDDYLFLTVYSADKLNGYGENKILNYGAECNYIATDRNKDLKSFLSNLVSLIDYTVNNYYIECDCAVNGIPYEASNDIKTIFSQGVSLITI